MLYRIEAAYISICGVRGAQFMMHIDGSAPKVLTVGPSLQLQGHALRCWLPDRQLLSAFDHTQMLRQSGFFRSAEPKATSTQQAATTWAEGTCNGLLALLLAPGRAPGRTAASCQPRLWASGR